MYAHTQPNTYTCVHTRPHMHTHTLTHMHQHTHTHPHRVCIPKRCSFSYIVLQLWDCKIFLVFCMGRSKVQQFCNCSCTIMCQGAGVENWGRGQRGPWATQLLHKNCILAIQISPVKPLSGLTCLPPPLSKR